MHSHVVSELGARLYLANGVTSVRFAGNDPDAVLALRESIETGRIPGPRVFSLGPLLDGISPDYPAMSWPLYSATEARLAVQRLKTDYRVDGIILTQKPALEIARAAVDEAHRLGIGVTGQTWSLTAREAVALGYDGLENTSRLPEAPATLAEAGLLRYRTIPERSAMLALLWARADAARLERLGHQMLKYETYLVPTLAGMDAMLGRYTARIRRDTDTRRLPAVDRRGLLEWLGQRFFGASWTPRDFANWARGRARYERFVRDYARLGRARPRGNRRAQALGRIPLPRGAPPAPGVRAARAPPSCGRPRRPRRTRSGAPTSAASRPAPRPTSCSSPATHCAAWPTRGPSGPSSSAGGSSSALPVPPPSNPNRVRRLS